MDKNQWYTSKDDLFESGKAYRNSLFGGGPSGGSPQQSSPFPGLPSGHAPYDPGWVEPPSMLPVPYQQPLQQQPATPSSPLGGLGNLPLKDIKSFIDRMGGIDGIMNTITKMNTLMKNVQQMAPMIKLLMGSFFKAKTTEDSVPLETPRRRRRKRRRARAGCTGHARYARSSRQKARKRSKIRRF